jgi:hypothetical protein
MNDTAFLCFEVPTCIIGLTATYVGHNLELKFMSIGF